MIIINMIIIDCDDSNWHECEYSTWCLLHYLTYVAKSVDVKRELFNFSHASVASSNFLAGLFRSVHIYYFTIYFYDILLSTNYTELFDYLNIRVSVRIIEVLLYFSSKYVKIRILTFLKQVLSDTFYET